MKLLQQNDFVLAVKKVLLDGKSIINKMVVANVTGINKIQAKGISIYFPINHIDSSYTRTPFAKNNLWLNFLKKVVSN